MDDISRMRHVYPFYASKFAKRARYVDVCSGSRSHTLGHHYTNQARSKRKKLRNRRSQAVPESKWREEAKQRQMQDYEAN